LERATTDRYRQHIDLNITPYIGALKLPKLTLPVLRVWQDRLRSDGKTQATVKGATVALSSILAEAMARGLAAQNVLRAMPRRKSTNRLLNFSAADKLMRI
jgi:hypothetical protein